MRILLAALAVFAAVCGTQAAASASRRPFEVGVAAYSWNWAAPELFPRMRAAGMTGARLSLYRDRGVYDLSVLRAELPVAAANGVSVVVNLMQEAATSTAGFAEWAASMAAHLPDVGRFVVGNEVNAYRFWHGTVGEYVDLLHATRAAIKSVRPDARVSGFGLDSTHTPVRYLARAAAYARRYGGLAAVMDTLSLHAYASPGRDVYLIRQAAKLWAGPVNVDEAGASDERRLVRLLAREPQVRNVFFYRFKAAA